VVANRTADSPELIEALRGRAAEAPTRFTLLVPAVPHGLAWAADMKAGWAEAALRAERAGNRIRQADLELAEEVPVTEVRAQPLDLSLAPQAAREPVAA
jgi:hypothetical protein